jgi:hypothetical protein
MASTTNVFDAYMQVYKDQAYSSKEHEGWVRDMLRQYPQLCQTTLIYHKEDETSQHHSPGGIDAKFRNNLMYPIPVYWGRSRDDLFSWDAVEKNFGYNKDTSQMSDELRDTIRYAIVGAVKVKAHKDLPERDAYVIHTEGVNLESPETAAFKSIVLGHTSERQILSTYFNRHRAMLKLIIEAAMSQGPTGKHAHIQAPMIGAGCFLRGLEGTSLNTEAFLQQQVLALEDVLNKAPAKYNFTYKLCIFNTNEFSHNIIESYQRLAVSNPRLNLGMNKDGGNVLANVPYGSPRQNVFVVNAGDLRSCIGNGMSYENSVEGFVVANARGYNPQWQNTSFLHNPYFNPSIFGPYRTTPFMRPWRPTMSGW